MKSYVRQTIAMFKGDTDKALAEKNYRSASSHIKVQISGIEGKMVEAEEKIELANEALKAAKFPTERISDSSSYLHGIRDAKSRLEEAQEVLNDLKEDKSFYEGLLAEYEEEVESPKEEKKD